MSKPNATGLRKKDTYEQMIAYLQNDQELIKYPNRYYRQLRDSPWLTQIDGEDQNEIEAQQLNEAKIVQRETYITEAAQSMGMSAQEARTIHQHITNNHNTTNNHYHQAPPPPPAPDAKMTADAGVGTEHPLKQSTGTGTDYMPPPDRFNPEWRPPIGVHVSTTNHLYNGVNSSMSGVRSAGTAPPPPTQSPEAQPAFNPHLDRHGHPKPERKIPVRATPELFNIASDNEDEPMNLQQEEAARKDFMAEEQRIKNQQLVSRARAQLDEVENMKARTPIKAASMTSNGVLNRHLANAQSNARARLVTQNRQSTEQAIIQSVREAERQRYQQLLAEQNAKHQKAIEDQIKQNIVKKEARDAEQRLREAQIENSRMNMKRLRVIDRRDQDEGYDSDATAFVYSGDEEEEPKKARKPVSPNKPPKAKKVKLDSEEAKEALNQGLAKASRIVPGKTALNAKYRKGIKEGLSNAKVKAQVQPQPDSTTTVIRKKKPGKITGVIKVKKGQMEKVRSVVLPAH
jgi:hypothetical protein